MHTAAGSPLPLMGGKQVPTFIRYIRRFRIMSTTLQRPAKAPAPPAPEPAPITAAFARRDAIRRLHELALQKFDDSVALRAIKMLLDVTEGEQSTSPAAEAKQPAPTPALATAAAPALAQPATPSIAQAPLPAATPAASPPASAVLRPPSITDQLAAPPLELPAPPASPLVSSRMLHMDAKDREIYGKLAATAAAAGNLASVLPPDSKDARDLAEIQRQATSQAQKFLIGNATAAGPKP